MGLRASDQRDVMPPPDDAAPPLRIRFIVSSLLITSPDRKDVIILMPNVEIAHLLTKRKNDERTNERKRVGTGRFMFCRNEYTSLSVDKADRT